MKQKNKNKIKTKFKAKFLIEYVCCIAYKIEIKSNFMSIMKFVLN